MTLALVLGAVCGLAAFVAARALTAPAPPLPLVLRRLELRQGPAVVAPTTTAGSSGLAGLFERRPDGPLPTLLGSLTLGGPRLDADLRLVGRTRGAHLATKVLVGLFGLLLPAAVGAVLALGGTGSGITLPVGAGLVLGAAFFFVPDLSLQSEAASRRDAFRRALGSFLDLVVISLAGGTGVETALRDAAEIGQGWAFGQLRQALTTTALTGETPWAALGRLGAELGVAELSELAASVSLAGTEGARVRDSLSAKATSLRDHELSEAETEAQSSTERMALPVVLLFLGFLILIGYPAIDAVVGV